MSTMKADLVIRDKLNHKQFSTTEKHYIHQSRRGWGQPSGGTLGGRRRGDRRHPKLFSPILRIRIPPQCPDFNKIRTFHRDPHFHDEHQLSVLKLHNHPYSRAVQPT